MGSLYITSTNSSYFILVLLLGGTGGGSRLGVGSRRSESLLKAEGIESNWVDLAG